MVKYFKGYVDEYYDNALFEQFFHDNFLFACLGKIIWWYKAYILQTQYVNRVRFTCTPFSIE